MTLMISVNGLKVLEKRYLQKDENGKAIETPEAMFRRISSFIATADKAFEPEKDTKELENKFYDIMSKLYFLPNSPTLMNAGRELGQLSACFVLPVEDSMEGIFDAIKHAAIIHKSGGGTGFSFSRLRSQGASVKSTGGVASGPISFMKVFNSATEAVKQGGVRRGANMGILRVDHPDILNFIQCKKNDKDITNFNISIAITEKFMEAVEKGEEYELIEPHTNEVTGKLKANEVFELIVDMAWNNGEPGIIFLDRMNKDNAVPKLGEIESTNPCGEQPLLPYESCNLGSINLLACVGENKTGKFLDYEQLGRLVDTSVHFLDNVIEMNKYPLDMIEEMTKKTRKIGLGVMGFADMLIELGIPYNSEEGVKTAESVMRFIDKRSKQASIKLAKLRGTFSSYGESKFAEKNIKLRNATTTTIAPTGTISIIAGVSSGIEPLFAISFVRNVMDNDELPEVNPLFEKLARERGFYSLNLMKDIAKSGSIKHIKGIPEDIKKLFVTSHDIDPIWHIKMQAAFQKYTDNAVSKTVNFRNDATKEEIREVYMLAYKLGCKGVTIYRDGSRESQVLNIGSVNKEEEQLNIAETLVPRVRPEVTVGITEKIKIGCGNLYVTVNSDDNGICEVFANLGRAGGCPSQSEATSRLISIALRSGVDIKEIIEQLRGIRCHTTLRQKGLKVLSCPDAIGRVLEKVLNLQVEVKDVETIHELTKAVEVGSRNCINNSSSCSTNSKSNCNNNCDNEATVALDTSLPWNMLKNCPECGSNLQHEGGCVICMNCGFSKCG